MMMRMRAPGRLSFSRSTNATCFRAVRCPLSQTPGAFFVRPRGALSRGAVRQLKAVASETAEAPQPFLADNGDAVRLPLQVQQLLGLKAGVVCRDSEINEAYDELLAAQVEAGYSSLTISGRQELLEEVRADMVAAKGRGAAGDPPGGASEVQVPLDLLPGALALLVQVGQHDLALTLGGQLLATEDLHAYPLVRDDVLLSMALANCGLAATCFEAGSQASAAYGYLEDGLRLLQRANTAGGEKQEALAPVLAAEIQAGLAPLRGKVALEQISAPLPAATDAAAQAGRKRALRAIRDLLKPEAAPAPPPPQQQRGRSSAATASASSSGTAPAAAGAVDSEVVYQLVEQLTAEEVVHLMEWEVVARSPTAYPWLYPGLLDTVVTAHLVTAFAQRQPAYARIAASLMAVLPGGGSGALELSRALCSVLLGSVDAAVNTLRTLRDTAADGAQKRGGRQPAVGVPPSLGGLPAPSEVYDFIVRNSPAGSEDGLLPGLCLYTQTWLREAAFPLFRDTATVPPSTSLSKYFDDTRVETLLEVYDERAAAAAAAAAASAGTGSARAAMRGVAAAAGAAAQDAADGVRATLTAAGALSSKAGSAPPPPRMLRLMAGGAALLALAGAALAATAFNERSSRRGDSFSPMATSASTRGLSSSSSPAAPVRVPIEQFDARVAEQLVRNWQDAKGASLGQSYATGPLGNVLAEPLLTEAKQKAASFQSQGWFMRYKLHKCKVTTVDSSAALSGGSEGFVRVVATLDETASLFGSDGQQADTHRSTYEAEYRVARQRDGAWRVTRLAVLGKNSGSQF